VGSRFARMAPSLRYGAPLVRFKAANRGPSWSISTRMGGWCTKIRVLCDSGFTVAPPPALGTERTRRMPVADPESTG
jgi:hypothetical protein